MRHYSIINKSITEDLERKQRGVKMVIEENLIKFNSAKFWAMLMKSTN